MTNRRYRVVTYVGGPYDGQESRIPVRKDGTYTLKRFGKPEIRNGRECFTYTAVDGNYYHESLKESADCYLLTERELCSFAIDTGMATKGLEVIVFRSKDIFQEWRKQIPKSLSGRLSIFEKEGRIYAAYRSSPIQEA